MQDQKGVEYGIIISHCRGSGTHFSEDPQILIDRAFAERGEHQDKAESVRRISQRSFKLEYPGHTGPRCTRVSNIHVVTMEDNQPVWTPTDLRPEGMPDLTLKEKILNRLVRRPSGRKP